MPKLANAKSKKVKVKTKPKNGMPVDIEEKKFENKYGYFTADGREFVITRPDTPRPWVNVISNGTYGIIESQTGSGFSWRDNSNLSRITRWEQDLIKDEWGKYIYIRDRTSKEVWSGTWKPCCPNFDFYEVRYGQGYSVLTSTYNGITTEKTIFVDAKEPVEIWKISLRNDSDKPRKLSVFSYFEWCLGNAGETHREFHKTFIETEILKSLGALWGFKRPALVPGFISTGLIETPLQAFLACSNIAPVAYDGDKETFFGRYGDIRAPRSVVEGKLKNAEGRWGDAVAALQVDVDLKPRETKMVIFLVGAPEDKKDAERIIKKYKTEAAVDAGLKEVKAMWDRLLTNTTVETPDDALNFMTNIWLKYQAISSRIWARCAYYQSSGAYGFRDQLQDSQTLLSIDSALTKKQILLHAEQQFQDGTVYHWWHPGTTMGAITGCSDDLLWLPFLTLLYIDETNDTKILDIEVDFLPDRETGKKEKGSLYEHCLRAFEKVISRHSPRGIPLMGECDWNDGLSHVGIHWKGESIWLAQFFYGILTRFAPLVEERGDEQKAKKYRKHAASMKDAVNKHAWDGQWYIGATRDDGRPLGSHVCDEGKIFLNTQTWAIINDTATPERAKIAMDSAERHLFREYGPLLLTPGYSRTDATIGYITRYAQSVRENGGVYTHAATWAVIAECLVGKGDKALQTYKSFSPPYRGLNPDLYFVEPYVMPGNVDGPDSPNFGRGGWTWYTGSAGWLYRVAIDWICGMHAEREGLRIDPVIPKDWPGFKAKRFFRGATYEIDVKNPKGISRGVREIKVDGKAIKGDIITPFKDSKTHYVAVVMG